MRNMPGTRPDVVNMVLAYSFDNLWTLFRVNVILNTWLDSMELTLEFWGQQGVAW